MNKIMFDDLFGLTKAVLEGRKTMSRRIVMQPPFDNYTLVFPTSDRSFDKSDPICGAFRWANKEHADEYTRWISPVWKVGEVVAVAQRYKDVLGSEYLTKKQTDGIIREIESKSPGCTNKMFVKADLMPRHIRITKVSLERLQDISDEDCLKEGIEKVSKVIGGAEVIRYYPSQKQRLSARDLGWGIVYDSPRSAFAELIERVSSPGVWSQNPYVFVYEFKLLK